MLVFIGQVFGCVLVLFGVLAGYCCWTFTYWKRRRVEGPPPSVPFGNAREVIFKRKNISELLVDAYVEHKRRGLRYCGLYMMLSPVVVVADLDLVRDITTRDFQHFTDHCNYVNARLDPLTVHLFTLKGPTWRRLRAKLSPAFTAGKIKAMYPIVSECAHLLLDVVDGSVALGDAFDMKEISARFTIDVIGCCAFGLECNSLADANSEFRKHSRDILEYKEFNGIAKFLANFFPKAVDAFNIKTMNKISEKFFIDTVRETVEFRTKNNIVRKDIMHLLIQLMNNVSIKDDFVGNPDKTTNDEKPLTMNEVAAQAYLFFIAGFETSSSTLTFCFYELSRNMKIQDKLRAEINAVLEKHQGQLAYEALGEMHYMEQCVNETLRKYPPLAFLNRECTKDYKVSDSNLIIEKGMRVFIPIYGIQHDPEYYPNPEKFDPDRFTPENRSTRRPFSWLPFGEGPRQCIGLRLGIVQIKVFLALLIKHYRFTLNLKTRTPLVLDCRSQVLHILGGIWLNAEKL